MSVDHVFFLIVILLRNLNLDFFFLHICYFKFGDDLNLLTSIDAKYYKVLISLKVTYWRFNEVNYGMQHIVTHFDANLTQSKTTVLPFFCT